MSEHRLRPGGVMRCCVETLRAYAEAHPDPPSEDTAIECNYCPSGLIYRSGAWEWDQDREPNRR